MATTNMNREAAEILNKVDMLLDRSSVSVDVNAVYSVADLLHKFKALVGAIDEDHVLVLRYTPDEVAEETFGDIE